MGIINKIKERIEGNHNSTERKNRMMDTESNRDEMNATNRGDPSQNERYDEPRNRMMDTISNNQLGASMSGEELTTDGYSQKNKMIQTKSNKQVYNNAVGGDELENNMMDSRSNELKDLDGTENVRYKALNSDRVR